MGWQMTPTVKHDGVWSLNLSQNHMLDQISTSAGLTYFDAFYFPITRVLKKFFFCFRLKELVPSVAAKENVTQLDVILEAIRYIDNLQTRLIQKIEHGEVIPVVMNTAEMEDSILNRNSEGAES